MGQGISTSNALSSLGLAKSEDVAEDITVELRVRSAVRQQLSKIHARRASGASRRYLNLSMRVIATAEAAGEAILSVYNSEVRIPAMKFIIHVKRYVKGPAARSVHPGTLQASKWEVELKADNSPLTKADTMANQIICRELQKMSPHVPIISEENKIVPAELRKVRADVG
eukprot:353000-Chlamydomonas_euryale.AAC.13